MSSWTDTFDDTTDIFATDFLQMFCDKIKDRVLAAGLDWPQGGTIYTGQNAGQSPPTPTPPTVINYYVSAVLDDGETVLSDPVAPTLSGPDFLNPMTSGGYPSWIFPSSPTVGVNLSWDDVDGAKYYKLYATQAVYNPSTDPLPFNWSFFTSDQWAGFTSDQWAGLTGGRTFDIQLLVRTTETSWTDNGSNLHGFNSGPSPFGWGWVGNRPPEQGPPSDSPAPTGLTATQTDSTPAYDVQPGDDCQLANFDYWTVTTPTSGYWGGDGIVQLSCVAGMQKLITDVLIYYYDPPSV